MRRVWMLLLALSACHRADASASASASSSSSAPAPSSASASGTIRGRVRFLGKTKAAEPIEHLRDEVCEKAHVTQPRTTRVGRDQGLLDVIVRIAPGTVHGDAALAPHARIEARGCAFVPFTSGALTGSKIELVNADPLRHHPHAFFKQSLANDTAFEVVQPENAAPAFVDAPPAPAILKVKDDGLAFMNAFVVVTDHPFFAPTDEEGRFVLAHVPEGTHVLEAVHPMRGEKRVEVTVRPGATVDAELTFTDLDQAP